MRNLLALPLAAACGAFALLAGAGAWAHARLLEANPAQNAAVESPRQIVLRFSEKLEPQFSGFEVTAAGAHVPLQVSLDKDHKSLVGLPAKPLAGGAYQVTWHVVSADGHRMQGGYAFTVR